jgi:gluconolactonase
MNNEESAVNESIQILAEGLNFPEGPAFDHRGALWCVELHGGNLVRWMEGRLERFATGGAPNGLAVDRNNHLWFCDAQQNAIRVFDPESGNFQRVINQVEGMPLNKPNDLAFDAIGNLLFTCPGDSRADPTGYVCCFSPDCAIKIVADKMYFPNGLAFADSGRTLIVAETYRQRLWRGVWDAKNLRWLEAQPWVSVGGAPGPDGMALGADGLMYVAVFGIGQVKAIDPTGQVKRTYQLPGKKPTNVAFDPLGNLGLVITEAEMGRLLCLPAKKGASLFCG